MSGIVRLVKLSKPGLHCELELLRAPAEQEAYLVNLREGKPNGEWRESSKTPFALDLLQARRLFQVTLESKLNQAYQLDSDSAPELASLIAKPAQATNLSSTATSARPVSEFANTNNSNESTAASILKQRLTAANWRQLDEATQSRTIWRIAHHRVNDVAARLIELLETGSAMLDYALAYALGRSADHGATLALFELSQRHRDSKVQRIARQAWLSLAEPGAKQFHASQIFSSWPVSLQQIFQQSLSAAQLEASKFALFTEIKRLELQSQQKGADTWCRQHWLEQCDEYALALAPSAEATLARALVLSACHEWELDSGSFRALRHLFKAAEFRDDYELYAILLQRFETTPARYWLSYGADSSLYLRGKWRRYRDEVKSQQSSVAYSNLTRDYLIRRGWRTLQEAAALDSAQFINYAMAYLRLCDDAHAGQIRNYEQARWDADTRRYQVETRHYDAYASWNSFNQLTRQHGPWQINRNGRKCSINTPQPPALQLGQRYEAYADIWDQYPDSLFELALHPKCQGVAEFAAAALATQQAYCAQLDGTQLTQLLQAKTALSQQLGLTILQQRLQTRALNEQELLALLNCDLIQATAIAVQTLLQQHSYAEHTEIMLALMLNPHQELRDQFIRLLAFSSAASKHNLLLSLIHKLTTHAIPVTQLRAALDLPACVWSEHLQVTLAQLDISELQACANLLLTDKLDAAELAAILVSRHPHGLQLINAASLHALLQHAVPAWQSIGVQLFSAYPVSLLRQHGDLLALLACSGEARIRQQIHPLFKHFRDDLGLQQRILSEIIDHLFRSDIRVIQDQQQVSLHQDLLKLAQTDLLAACRLLELDLQWRLLQAQSRGAQEFAAWLLNDEEQGLAQALSLTQWLQLAKHPQQLVRLRLQNYCLQQAELVANTRNESLALFNSKWPDMLDFATEFFQSRVALADWQLAQLIQLCDHPQAQVQRLGRQLILQRFNAAEAAEFVAHLAEHPSASMQLFVSQWLETAITQSSDGPALLQQLHAYFLSVLSHVNKARTVKSRIIQFLSEYALQSQAAANYVANLFSRLVLTVTLRDKAAYILSLQKIGQHYPELMQTADWPVQILAVPQKLKHPMSQEPRA